MESREIGEEGRKKICSGPLGFPSCTCGKVMCILQMGQIYLKKNRYPGSIKIDKSKISVCLLIYVPVLPRVARTDPCPLARCFTSPRVSWQTSKIQWDGSAQPVNTLRSMCRSPNPPTVWPWVVVRVSDSRIASPPPSLLLPPATPSSHGVLVPGAPRFPRLCPLLTHAR